MMKTEKYSQETVKGAELVQEFQAELIERVTETRRIAKALLKQGLMGNEEHRVVVSGPSSRERMAKIFRALEAEGTQAMGALYRLLLEHEPEVMLEMERCQFLNETKEDLFQRLTSTEAVANQLLEKGLLSEEAYFSVSGAQGDERRARELWAQLEAAGTTAKDGFYRVLIHCQPLLYRELEIERVMRMCGIDRENEANSLEKRRDELQKEEKRLQLERENMKKERDELERAQKEARKAREAIWKEVEQLRIIREEMKENDKVIG